MTWRICKVFILSGLLALSFSVKSKAIGKVAGKIGDADIEFLLWQANIECFHPYFAFMVQPFFAAHSLHHLEDQMCINNCVSDSMSPEIRKEVTRRLSDFYLRLDNEKISGFPLPGGLNTMRPGCGASKNYIIEIISRDGSPEAEEFFGKVLDSGASEEINSALRVLAFSLIKRPKLYGKITEDCDKGLITEAQKIISHLRLDPIRAVPEAKKFLLNSGNFSDFRNVEMIYEDVLKQMLKVETNARIRAEINDSIAEIETVKQKNKKRSK